MKHAFSIFASLAVLGLTAGNSCPAFSTTAYTLVNGSVPETSTSATWNFGGSAGAGNGIAYQVFGFTSSTSFPPAGAGLVNRGKTLTQGKTAMQ